MQEMNVRIRTKTPVVLSSMGGTTVMTETYDFFRGSVLRGFLASRFIAARRLGRDAHEDDDFMRLFYGALRFVDAYPIAPATDQRSMILPRSLQRQKDGKEMRDLSGEDTKPAANFKGVKGFGTILDGAVHPIEVRKSLFFHMSRTDLGDGSGAERLAGKSRDSGIYNYEAIAAGQTFEGAIYGPKDLLACLRDTVGASFSCRMGRSRNTQYGLCEITLGAPETAAALAPPESQQVRIRLETPFLPQKGRSGDACAMIGEIVEAFNRVTSGGFSLSEGGRHIFSAAAEIENFVGIWGMRRPQEMALAAGSLFTVDKASPWQAEDSAALTEIFYDGVGRRREEGFGQLRIWAEKSLHWIEAGVEKALERQPLGDAAKQAAKRILLAHVIEQIEILAAEDAEELNRSVPQNTRHFFSRLGIEMGTRKDRARQRLQRLASETENGQTPMGKRLKESKIHGTTLWDYLRTADFKAMPYSDEGATRLKGYGSLAAAAEEIGLIGGLESLLRTEDVYFAYWNALFRYGRKSVAESEERREEE